MEALLSQWSLKELRSNVKFTCKPVQFYLSYTANKDFRHKEALKHARMGAKLSQKLIKKLLQLCTSFKHMVHGQKLRYPRSFSLQDSISLIQKNSEKLYPILKQLVKRLVPQKLQCHGHQGTVTTNFTGDPMTATITHNKKTSSIITNKHGSIQSNIEQQQSKRKGNYSSLAYDDSKIDMRNLLGYVNQNQWISSLNIGNIMQISPISANELLTYTHNQVQLTRDVILQKVGQLISLLVVSYFCVSTQIRFILQLKQDPSYDPVSKLKQSQYWHAKSLEIVCSFLPSDCPLLNHILLSYQKHHSPSQQTIPQDAQAQVGVSVLRPLQGIQAQKFQPIIRSIQGLNFILSPAQTPRGYFAELEVELDDDELQELEQIEDGPQARSKNQVNQQQPINHKKSNLNQNQDNGGDDQMNASIDIDLGQNDSFSLQAQFLAKDRSQSSFTKRKPVPPSQNFPPGRQSNRSIKSANKISSSSSNNQNHHHHSQISDNNNIINTQPSQLQDPKIGKVYQKQLNPQRLQNNSASLSKLEQRQCQVKSFKNNNKSNNIQDDGEQQFMSDGLEQDSLLQNISLVKPSTAAAAGAKRHNSTGADIRSDQKKYLLHHNASVTSGMTMAGVAQKNVPQIQKRPSSTQQNYHSQNDKIFQPKRNLHSALGTNVKYQSKIMPSHSQQLRPQSAKRKNFLNKNNSNSIGDKGRGINNSFSNHPSQSSGINTSFQQLNQSLQQQMIDYGNKSNKLNSGSISQHQLVDYQQQQQFNLANGIQNKKINFPNSNNSKKLVTSALPRKGNVSLHHYEELKSKLINQYKAQKVLRQHTNVTNDKKNISNSNTHSKQQKIPASMALRGAQGISGSSHQGSSHHMGGRSSSHASSNFMNKRNHIAFRVFNQNKSPNPSHRNLTSNQSHSQLQQMNVSVIQGQVGGDLFESDQQQQQQNSVNRSFQIQGQQGAHLHHHSQQQQSQQRVKASSPFSQGFLVGKSHGNSGSIGRRNDKKIASIYSHHGGSSSPFESQSGGKKVSRVKSTTGGGTNIVSDLNVAMEKHFKKASDQALKFLLN